MKFLKLLKNRLKIAVSLCRLIQRSGKGENHKSVSDFITLTDYFPVKKGAQKGFASIYLKTNIPGIMLFWCSRLSLWLIDAWMPDSNPFYYIDWSIFYSVLIDFIRNAVCVQCSPWGWDLWMKFECPKCSQIHQHLYLSRWPWLGSEWMVPLVIFTKVIFLVLLHSLDIKSPSSCSSHKQFQAQQVKFFSNRVPLMRNITFALRNVDKGARYIKQTTLVSTRNTAIKQLKTTQSAILTYPCSSSVLFLFGSCTMLISWFQIESSLWLITAHRR